jgi:hypothetical protein
MQMFNQQNDNLLNILSVFLALQNLQENREQSAHNDVQIANDNQAKLILTEINGKFAEQNKMLEEILNKQNQILSLLSSQIDKQN